MLSLVVPVYNETRRLGASLAAIAEALPESRAEVLFVDDGSTDGSAGRIEAFAARKAPHFRVLRADHRGKGHAIRTGMLEARGDPIFFSDLDLSVPLDAIDDFLPRFAEGFDMVVGSRRIEGSRIDRHQPRLRESMGAMYTRLSRWILGVATTDFTCGFKGFSRRGVEEVFRRAVVDGWSFDAELFFLAKARGLRIREVPVRWTNSPETRVRLVRDTLGSFVELLRIRMRAARGRYDGPARGRPEGSTRARPD